MSWIIDQNLDPTLQDWGEAYKELCGLIKAKLPEVKHIDFYYGQDQFVQQDGEWNPFPCPAVLLDFRAAQVRDLGDHTQELHMDVTMYLYLETVQDTHHGSAGQRRAMEFVGLMRTLHQAMHGASGEHFSPLSRVDMQRKADAPPYAYVFGQTYRCVLLDNSGSKQWSFREPGTLGLEIEPYSAPPVNDRLVVVRNSDGSYRVEVLAPSDHFLPNVVHTDSDGSTVSTPAMTPFVATACVGALPATARLLQSGGGQIGADHTIPAGGSLDITAPDGGVTVRNSNGQAIGTGSPMSGQTIEIPIADGAFRIKDSAGNDIGPAHQVPAAGTAEGIVADSTITKPDGSTTGLRATQPLDVRSFRSGILYAWSEARWSGQVTSHRFGDEGTAYATLFFRHSNVPVYPEQIAALGSTWTTLASLNKWGDNRRFTDRSGGNTYSDRIIHDHLTDLYWYSPTTPPTGNWNTAIDAAVASTAGGLTGWLLPPMQALQSIINNQGGTLLNYAPFAIDGMGLLTSTTTPGSVFAALPMLPSGAFQSVSKNTLHSYIFCRKAET